MKRVRVIRVGFALVVLTSLFSVAVRAQGFHYGPMVELSINSSDVRSEHFSRPQIGCNIGGVVRYEFQEHHGNAFFLQSGLNFQYSGRDMMSHEIAKRNIAKFLNMPIKGFSYHTFDLAIPLQTGIKMDLGKRALSLRFGIYGRIGLYSKATVSAIDTSFNPYAVGRTPEHRSVSLTNGSNEDVILYGFDRFGFGLMGGVDMEITRNWLIGLTYQQEITELYKTPFAPSHNCTIYPGLSSLSLTYLF